jgi:CheY-like chemotaxis protein
MLDETIAQLEPQQAGSSRPSRILIVDDDQAQVFALHYRLKKLGYETAAAYSGCEALEAASQMRPDLVVLDLRLPDTTGFDVCERLADAPSTCGVPIIIVSAMERPDIVRQARSAGCAYYVRKPYDPNVLLALIKNSLEQDTDAEW